MPDTALNCSHGRCDFPRHREQQAQHCDALERWLLTSVGTTTCDMHDSQHVHKVITCSAAQAQFSEEEKATSYLIAQVFYSSDQVMQHWIAIVIGFGQSFLHIVLGVARLD